jgi:hypothetical protein
VIHEVGENGSTKDRKRKERNSAFWYERGYVESRVWTADVRALDGDGRDATLGVCVFGRPCIGRRDTKESGIAG